MRFPILLAAACGAMAMASPATAQSDAAAISAITLSLSSSANTEILSVDYRCEELEPFTVKYINAPPNYLALVPVNDEQLVFSSVISGSGARYVAGNWVWWSSGSEANLYDETQGEDADPVASCLEASDTP